MPASVITFYSFKGGVGRTQTLANMAVGLANRGRNVVAVDMDLESPGLHTYFYPPGAKAPLSDSDIGARDGLLEHLERCRAVPAAVPKIDEHLVEVTHPSRRPGAGWIRFLPAGRLTEDYPERVARFSWERFYGESHGSQYMELLRDQLLATGADFVLLDSRTGMTDVASICTFQLPDVVVILFALHQQGLDGAARVAQAIKRSREEDEARSRRVLLVPARVDEQCELGLRDEWLLRVRLRMSGLGELLVEQGQHIPYLPRVAYGEQIVIDPVEPNLLSAAYEHLLGRLDIDVGITAPRRGTGKISFVELRRNARCLIQRLVSLADTIEASQPATMTLAVLQGWIQERTALLEEVRVLGARVLAFEIGVESKEKLSALLASATLDSPSEWRALARVIASVTEHLIEEWTTTMAELVHLRLLAAARGDQDLVRPYLDRLQPLLQEGPSEELEAQLEKVEREVTSSRLEEPRHEHEGGDEQQRLRCIKREADEISDDLLFREDLEDATRQGIAALHRDLLVLVSRGDLVGALGALDQLRALQEGNKT